MEKAWRYIDLFFFLLVLGGGRNIMSHSFFSGGVGANAHLFPAIDFLLLEQRQLEPPWVPEFSHEKPRVNMRKKVRTKEIGKEVKYDEMVSQEAKKKDPVKTQKMTQQFYEWAMIHDAVKAVKSMDVTPNA